jgi:hypothetical protein
LKGGCGPDDSASSEPRLFGGLQRCSPFVFVVSS